MENYKIITLYNLKAALTVETGNIFGFKIHSHTYYELTLYEPFDGSIVLNDTEIPINTLTAILTAPFDFHKSTLKRHCSSKYIKIVFTPDLFDSDQLPKTSMILKDIAESDFIVKLYNEILGNSDNIDYSKALLGAAICIIFQKGEKILPSKIRNGTQFGIEAVKIINEGFNENLTLSEVAKRLYITPQYLSKTFKEDVGITFSEYLTNIRLKRAEKLLAETNESITKICEICGYRNFSHFLRSFKTKNSISPSEYRKSKTSSNEKKQ